MQFGGSFGQYNTSSPFFISKTARDWNSDFFFRFGLNNKTELNIGIGLARMAGFSSQNIIPHFYNPYVHFSHPTRFNSLNAGIRHTFFNESDHDFSLAVLVLGNLNKTGRLGIVNEYGYTLGLLGAKQIGSRISATGNIGLQHNDSWTGPELYYVVNFAFDLGYNTGLFVETKNQTVLADNSEMQQWYNSGMYWKLTPNFMLDFYGGYNRFLSGNFSENYLFGAVGLSWKIKAIATKKPVAP